MEQRKFPITSRCRLLCHKWASLTVILSVTLFAIQPAIWAKTKTEVMECTMKNGEIVDKSGHTIGACVLMKDGHMMMMTGGKMMPITKDITLADGTVCRVGWTEPVS
jgi:hypothetical protein